MSQLYFVCELQVLTTPKHRNHSSERHQFNFTACVWVNEKTVCNEMARKEKTMAVQVNSHRQYNCLIYCTLGAPHSH